MTALRHALFLKFESSSSSAEKQVIFCKWSPAAVKAKQKDSALSISIASALQGAMYL